jgi:hypothetical protein
MKKKMAQNLLVITDVEVERTNLKKIELQAGIQALLRELWMKKKMAQHLLVITRVINAEVVASRGGMELNGYLLMQFLMLTVSPC